MRSKWLFHPITVFIFSLIALGLSLFLYIHWYLKVNNTLLEFVNRYNIDQNQIFKLDTWIIILSLSILVGIILVGILIIFIYYQKVIVLYRQQQNFINGFTHELKTPIASIKLYLDTFLKHSFPREKQLEYFKYMLIDADRLSNNVNRILNLSKIEDGDYKNDFEALEITSITREIVSKNKHLYESGEVNLNFNSEGFYISLNYTLYEILLTNLITNSFTHNNSDKPIVNITIFKTKNDVILKIVDNGIGIEKSEQKKVFRKFYQVGNVSKGNGLGLYLVSQMAKIHKAKVKVCSDGIDKGCTFEVVFPDKKVTYK